MSSDPVQSDPENFRTWMDRLVCPACLSALSFGTSDAVCTACHRIYPLLDGIPILIVERAVREHEPRVPPAPGREFGE